MRILIVEDERRLAEALGAIMEEQKYSADVVFNGQDGLDYALSGQYDVIVLDVMLPKMNGFEVAHELRRQNVRTPVLMLTARDELSSKVTGLDSGADDYQALCAGRTAGAGAGAFPPPGRRAAGRGKICGPDAEPFLL